MGWLHCDPDAMFKVQPYSGPAVWAKLPPSLQVCSRGPLLAQRCRVLRTSLQSPHRVHDAQLCVLRATGCESSYTKQVMVVAISSLVLVSLRVQQTLDSVLL